MTNHAGLRYTPSRYTMGCAVLSLAMVTSAVGAVMLLIAAFRVGIGWGLAVLLLPFANVVFAVKYWERAKLGFLLQLGGVALAVASVLAFGLGAVMGGRLDGFGPGATPELGGPAEVVPALPPPTPTPPPPPDPTPTVYLPEALLDYTPAARPVMRRPTVGPDEEFVLTLQNADQRLGWTMTVTTSDGRSFEGTLLAVDERSMTFERRLGSGSMIFPIPRAEIQKLELAQ